MCIDLNSKFAAKSVVFSIDIYLQAEIKYFKATFCLQSVFKLLLLQGKIKYFKATSNSRHSEFWMPFPDTSSANHITFLKGTQTSIFEIVLKSDHLIFFFMKLVNIRHSGLHWICFIHSFFPASKNCKFSQLAEILVSFPSQWFLQQIWLTLRQILIK